MTAIKKLALIGFLIAGWVCGGCGGKAVAGPTSRCNLGAVDALLKAFDAPEPEPTGTFVGPLLEACAELPPPLEALFKTAARDGWHLTIAAVDIGQSPSDPDQLWPKACGKSLHEIYQAFIALGESETRPADGRWAMTLCHKGLGRIASERELELSEPASILAAALTYAWATDDGFGASRARRMARHVLAPLDPPDWLAEPNCRDDGTSFAITYGASEWFAEEAASGLEVYQRGLRVAHDHWRVNVADKGKPLACPPGATACDAPFAWREFQARVNCDSTVDTYETAKTGRFTMGRLDDERVRVCLPLWEVVRDCRTNRIRDARRYEYRMTVSEPGEKTVSEPTKVSAPKPGSPLFQIALPAALRLPR